MFRVQPLFRKSFATTAVRRSLFVDYVNKIQPSVKEITAADLEKKLTSDPVHGPPETLHILDVRETYEWNESHIPNAVYTGRGNLERDIEQLVPDAYDEIVVYCASGKRSVLAADALNKMGYKNVFSLQGGIGQWKKDQKPVVHSSLCYNTRLQYGVADQ
ncbi:Rhodanese-like domain-containing protein [Gorgonomyces haynaldii]|nr:Rhodanese-like domain-containing protein [Gorgonomyces haynaldii]